MEFDILKAVITDSEFLAEELRTRFQVPPSLAGKLVSFATPIRNPPPVVQRATTSQTKRPQIFWAGRFDRQKRVDIVVAIAQQ